MDKVRLNELYKYVVSLQLKKPRSVSRITNNYFSRLCVSALYCYYNDLDEKQILKIYRKNAAELLKKATEDGNTYEIFKKGWFQRDFIQLKSQSTYESIYANVVSKISRENEIDSMGVLSIIAAKTVMIYNLDISNKERRNYMKYVKETDERLYKICRRIDAIIAASSSY